jgi:hypothetical protein
MMGIPAAGISGGRVLCSYACRPYALWPVSATPPNADCLNSIYCLRRVFRRGPREDSGNGISAVKVEGLQV